MEDPIRIPLPLQHIGSVNAWLLRGDPLTLIDTGPRDDEALSALEAGLAHAGVRLEDIELVLVTHHHVDHAGLAATIERFNSNAAKGVDPDFGRGESAYNRNLGDPSYKPNPCLGPLDRAPFYATEVVPGDIGTCGGLLTNEDGQVLDQQDRPIEGLYATGNNTATVMGRHYLGAGASIANTMVFGYRAARHATEIEAKAG